MKAFMYLVENNKSGIALGNLYILIIGKRPCNWINLQKYIDSEGPSPSARYGHSMHYSPELNFVVLFGGRNDSFGAIQNCIFNDIWILRLNLLQWVQVESHGEVPDKRYNHCSTLLGTQLIIFGGINGNTYTNSSLYIWEMEKVKAFKQIMNNGKKRTSFEDPLEDKSITKYSMKKSLKKEKDLISIFQNKKQGPQLTQIEILEKKIKEAKFNNSSEYQIKILQDELK